MALLDVENVRVTFGGLHAVDGLSTTIRQGQIKGIIGPNGAGKTTLFNAIAGLQSLSNGRILLEGQPITALPPFRRARLGLARTFQNLQIFPDLSLVENVMIGAQARAAGSLWHALLGGARQRSEEMRLETLAYEKLAWMGLADRAGASARGLSFGEAKLLEIARALAAEPKLLLLDEPVAGVPASEQAPIAETIRRVNAAGVTVLLVEHNMRMVMGLCDEILVLQSGRFLAEGPPQKVAADPEVIGAYLGTEVGHA